MKSDQIAQLRLFQSDVELMSSPVLFSGLYSLSSFNFGFVGKVRTEAKCSPCPTVQYLICNKLFSDDILCHHSTLPSGLHVYAVTSDFSSDDAFYQCGKESVSLHTPGSDRWLVQSVIHPSFLHV